MPDDRDDRVVRLLEEIRDTQREHLEKYKEGLKNQAESVAMQREITASTRKRLRLVFGLIIVVLVMIMGVIGMLLWRIMGR